MPVLLLTPVSLVLLTLPLLIGRETNGATNWFYVGSLSVQPSEIVKLSLLLIISYYMSRHRMLPWLGFAVCCLALLMLQKDLGTALMYYGTTLLLYYASASNLLLTGVGLAGGAGAAVLGYQMFAHVKEAGGHFAENPWSSDYEKLPASRHCAGVDGHCQWRIDRRGSRGWALPRRSRCITPILFSR